MIRKKQGNIQWLEFELLQDFPLISHAVFLRHGGISAPSYFSSLNALQTCGDDFTHVQENRKRMCNVLGLQKLALCKHAHEDRVMLVKEAQEEPFFGYDALMTAQVSLGLLITHADCQAAIFYDPIHHVCANVHAGWRGQVKNIYRRTIEHMAQAFDTKPADLLVCISPSLGPEHSEFKNYETEIPKELWRFQIKPTYFDLWAIARHELEISGILSHHIQIAQIDTYENSEDFFSYRREKVMKNQGLARIKESHGITGGHGTIIALKS